MYLLLDVAIGPLWSPSDTVSKYTAIRWLPPPKNTLPPMPQQKLPKVIKEHLPPDSDLHEPTLISPKTCPSAFFPPH